MTTQQMIEAFEKETGQDWDNPETVQQEMNRLLWTKAWDACLANTIEKLRARKAAQDEIRAVRFRNMYIDRRA